LRTKWWPLRGSNAVYTHHNGEFPLENVISASEIDQKLTPKNPQKPDVTHSGTPTIDTALAFALTEAAKAGRFDVVAQLAKELEARRLASSPNVVALDSVRGRQ
jgi:hypothetical protein